MRKYPIVEIEDVMEPFCGCRRKNMVPLSDAEKEVADEWLYSKNAGWGPEHFSRSSGVRCWWVCCACHREYKAQIANRTGSQRSGCPYSTSKRVCSDNSLADQSPAVAAEWHPKKNKKLTPRDFTHASSKHAWWLCKVCKHEWECAISDRTTLESGCPACYESRLQYTREHPKPRVKKPVVLGSASVSRLWYEKESSERFVSIKQSCPKIAKQWHPKKNGKWTPSDFSKGSDAIAWWKCNVAPDHEWQAPISSRTSRDSDCPFCSGKRASKTNSVAQFPRLVNEWHPQLNGELRPEHVTCGSGKKVWWRCAEFPEHEWQTVVHLRTAGSRCPFCSGARVSERNSLQSLFPKIAEQLHASKNGRLSAHEIASSSSEKYWWKCPEGPDHEWQATPANRTGLGSGCPFCSGKKISVTNSLATLYPKVAKDWDKRQNGKLSAADVSPASTLKVFWICPKKHSWQQPILGRVGSSVGCWECSGRKRPGPK